MLDNIEYIKKIDRYGMHTVLANFPTQFEDAIKIAKNTKIEKIQPSSIICAGMGGSGIGGDILASYAYDICQIPFVSCKSYDLPAFTDKNTLVFCVSYSGNTEETLSVTQEALKKQAHVIAITSGGKLEKICKKNNLTVIKIPANLQPRCAIGYLFVPMLLVLDKMQILDTNHVSKGLKSTVKVLKALSKKLQIFSKTGTNPAKQLAYKLFDTYPTIYGHTYYSPIAKRFRTQLNENAKILARDDIFPEQSHNDIVGWYGDMNTKTKSVVLLRDEYEQLEIRKRIEITKRIAFKNAEQIIEIWCKGDTKLSRMFYALYIGDFTSFYLAILRKIDPTPVKIIEHLKKMLAK
jgi:glucose/mannose-6-phosphate isomerase